MAHMGLGTDSRGTSGIRDRREAVLLHAEDRGGRREGRGGGDFIAAAVDESEEFECEVEEEVADALLEGKDLIQMFGEGKVNEQDADVEEETLTHAMPVGEYCYRLGTVFFLLVCLALSVTLVFLLSMLQLRRRARLRLPLLL